MANEEQVQRLQRGVLEWNEWRAANPLTLVNLRGAHLSGAELSGADLGYGDVSDADLERARADMRETNLRGADLPDLLLRLATPKPDLTDADLRQSDLRGANLRYANLSSANLCYADLSGANLDSADLGSANLTGVGLSGANLEEARLAGTVFADVNLTGVTGLETCVHEGPSFIDYRALQISGPLPLAFLRGIGLPDNFIDYLPSLLNQPIQHYSCFISYSSKDDEFAHCIHADLQNKGVRCWFAPHDLPIGDKILDALDAAIRLREKVVLILSEHSIKSDWVEDEVTAGFEEERKRGQIVPFPVRLDEAVLHTKEAWAAKLRARNIGDFRKWKDHDAYKQGLARVLRRCRITLQSLRPVNGSMSLALKAYHRANLPVWSQRRCCDR
jgi:uncharacterized protein YjbI with pentapeptide repeats